MSQGDTRWHNELVSIDERRALLDYMHALWPSFDRQTSRLVNSTALKYSYLDIGIGLELGIYARNVVRTATLVLECQVEAENRSNSSLSFASWESRVPLKKLQQR